MDEIGTLIGYAYNTKVIILILRLLMALGSKFYKLIVLA